MICVSWCVWLHLMLPRMNAMCENIDVCLCAWVSGRVCVCVRACACVCVCVSLDKTVNPQATRTQYPVCPFLISCLSLAEWEAAGRGWRGTAGPVAPETGDTAARFEKSLRRSPYLSLSGATPYSLSLSPLPLCFYYLRFNKAKASSLFCHETFISCLLWNCCGGGKMMGSHLTLCKNSGNITPTPHTCTQKKDLMLHPFLKISDTSSLPSLSHFKPFLRHWDFSLINLYNFLFGNSTTSKHKNSLITTFLLLALLQSSTVELQV